MKTDSKIYPLADLNKLNKEKINTQSDYQRPEVWRKSQKQLLIDSIMRGYDIPKIYVKQETEGQFDYEVIDGQQRLVAIWDFFDGKFGLPKGAKPINGIECSSKNYDDLDMALRKDFDNYEVNFVIVTEATQNKKKDEIGDLFLRLQNGTPLNAQEKRNAMPGKMRDFVKKLAKHRFFEYSYYPKNIRYNYDQLAAQFVLMELELQKSGKPAGISNSSLDMLYKRYNAFDENGETAQKIKQTLDYLHLAFPSVTHELVQHSAITLYCLASRLLKNNTADGTEKALRDCFMAFERERRQQDDLDRDQKDSTFLEYKNCIVGPSNKQVSIEKRLKILEERFFKSSPDLLPKDVSEN